MGRKYKVKHEWLKTFLAIILSFVVVVLVRGKLNKIVLVSDYIGIHVSELFLKLSSLSKGTNVIH